MSIAALKTEIASLPLEERRELIGYIVSLNRKNNDEFMRKLTEKIDDKSPSAESRLMKPNAASVILQHSAHGLPSAPGH
jgi:hypothetical protein